MNVFVTGASGFIGMHLCTSLMKEGHQVFALDWQDVDSYGIRGLREAENLTSGVKYLNSIPLKKIFKKYKIDLVVHLGVVARRYDALYIHLNEKFLVDLFEAAKGTSVNKILYASTAAFDNSVYSRMKSGLELVAARYSLPSTSLRICSAYGAFGRPDMFTWRATQSIIEGEILPVDLTVSRDFIYVSDVVRGIYDAINEDEKVVSIGTGKSTKLMTHLQILESLLGKQAIIRSMNFHTPLVTLGKPSQQKFITLEDGLALWVSWYLKTYT